MPIQGSILTETSPKSITFSYISAEKKKIFDDYTPKMVEALGGIDKVLNLPVIEKWDGITYSAPIMRGYHENGSPLLMFCYLKRNKYDITGEYLVREDKSWKGCYENPNEFNLRSKGSIIDDSLEEKFMLDKISRLSQGLAVGVIKKYPGLRFRKPNDKRSFLPSNAYLSEKELNIFMDLNTLFYENKPHEGFTEIFLYDHRISAEENATILFKNFPLMQRKK